MWPTWGKIYAGWILESVYQALTEGLRAAGSREVKVDRRSVMDGGGDGRRFIVIKDRGMNSKGRRM